MFRKYCKKITLNAEILLIYLKKKIKICDILNRYHTLNEMQRYIN